MNITIYQVDAFADEVFKGNPAAICPLTTWLPDETLQQVAAENNLSETAFYVPNGNGFDIRWFTPAVEVELCGHATLAAAFVLFYHEGYKGDTLHFHSHRSGALTVKEQGGLLVLNFPKDRYAEVPLTNDLLAATDKRPLAAFKGKTDYMLVFEREEDIKTMTPNLPVITGLDARGLIVTAKGNNYDFVSRFFGPASGINEDPVTGSAHTTLIPYWAQQSGKNELSAIQLSERTGVLHCSLLDERVTLAGKGVLFMKGEIFI
jgi:PhzF family phenazine biosynthesis protein